MTDFVADVWWFEMKLRHILSQIVYPKQWSISGIRITDLLFSKTFRTTHNYSMHGSSSRSAPWYHAVNPIEPINDDFNHSLQRRPHTQSKLINVRQALHEVCNILQA